MCVYVWASEVMPKKFMASRGHECHVHISTVVCIKAIVMYICNKVKEDKE